MGRKGRGHMTDEVLRWPDTVHTEEPQLINVGDSQSYKLPEVVRPLSLTLTSVPLSQGLSHPASIPSSSRHLLISPQAQSD